MWTVNVQFRQIEDVAVRVLARGQNARDNVRFIHVIRDACKVFPFPNLHTGVCAHALHEKYVVPVAHQLCLVFLDQAAFAQHGFHRVDVFPNHIFRCRSQVGIKGEIVRREAGRGQALNNRSPYRCG